MRINKVVAGAALGLALGIMTLGASANTVDAKAKPITVTVDKADSATAKKVDAALRKGKKVVLKVRGNKKASKNLLVKLQTAVGIENKFGVLFDLDNGDEKYAGRGNAFQTYANLYYKQSGKYGCYTITKSSANAYKYCILGTNKAYKEFIRSISKSEYDKYVKKLKSEASKDYTNGVDSIVYEFAEAYIEEHGGVMTDSVNEAIGIAIDLAGGDRTDPSDVEDAQKLLSRKGFTELFELVYNKACEVFADTSSSKEPEIPTYREFVVKVKGKAVADFYFGDSDTLIKDRQFRYVGWRYYLQDNSMGHLRFGTDEYRLERLYKGTHGVCDDLAACDMVCFDYIGVKSYHVLNKITADHAICCVSPKEYNIPHSDWIHVGNNTEGEWSGTVGDDNRAQCDTNTGTFGYKGVSFSNVSVDLDALSAGVNRGSDGSYYSNEDSREVWKKLIKEAMGADCPY